ncbi:sensor histidine kinase [Burkholderia sp. 22PA0099]|uniref:sensor histidine kinase n=1 Tax=Burkholderia sp. 22PA0099 TaxID=3237372 RepID=UPI0039C32FC8
MDRSRIAFSANAVPAPDGRPACASLLADPMSPASDPSSAHRAHLADLSAELAAADEHARHHLARELHDGLGADLTGARFALANLDTWLPDDAPDGCRQALALAQQALDAAMESYRRALDNAAPQLDAGLVSTLSGWVGAFGARTGLRTSVVCAADARLAQLTGDGALAALRVTQEALANVARHANARSADVRLDATATHLELSIADDGAGFGTQAFRCDAGQDSDRTGRGLLHMQARCAAFDGALAIEARPNGGTLLRARFAWSALAGRPVAAAQASVS